MRSVIERWRPRSLRRRLIVWTCALVTLLFAGLSLATYIIQARTLGENAHASVNRERAIAQAALAQNLAPDAPYWPVTLQIPEIDAYTAPGVTIAITDTSGKVRY